MSKHKLLELQSDRIEMVLATHKAPARVTGGVVTPRAIQFHLAPLMGTKVNKLQALADELALALGVSDVRVSREGGSVRLEVPRDDAQPVKLLPLIERMLKSGPGACPTPLPAFTAVLGMCEDGAPLLLRLSSPDVAHVLISGTTGSGKTVLCQTMILSLAMTHRRSQLQFVLIDPKQRAFAPFKSLPHLLGPVAGSADEAVHVLESLVQLMEARDRSIAGRQVDPTPHIVVVVDELADLVHVSGRALTDPLTRLAQRGREAGVHVIACTQKPSSQVLGPLIKANFPARLIGKVVSPEDARVASGIGGTNAEKLTGRGDFLAVAAGQIVRFQSAYVSPAEMKQVVAECGSTPRRWDVIKSHPSLSPPSRGLQQAAANAAR